MGPGITKRLERHGIYTMGQVVGASEELLYKILGIDADARILKVVNIKIPFENLYDLEIEKRLTEE